MVRNLKNIKNPLFVIPVEVRIRLSILNKYVTASLSQNLNFRKLGIFSWIIVDETWKEPCDDSVFANGDVTYLICHLNSHDRMMERLYEFLGRSSYLCHNHDKFGDQSHCDSKNWIILIFHVTWCDDVFQGFSNFMGRSSLWVEVPHGKSTRFYVWCHWSGASRDKMYLICHVTSHKPHNGRIVRLYEWEILIVFYYLAKFGGHRHCGSGYVMLLIYLWSSNNTWWYGHVTLREESPHGRSAPT